MKKIFTLSLIAMLLFPANNASSAQPVCSKTKLNKIVNNQVCSKVKGTYKWVKIVKKQPTTTSQKEETAIVQQESTPVVPQPEPSPTPTVVVPEVKKDPAIIFNNICAEDPLAPIEWAEYQKFALDTFKCSRPLRFLDYNIETVPVNIPNTIFTDDNVCKIKSDQSHPIGFRSNYDFSFNGNVNIQVLPISFTDYNSTSKPADDYGKYFNFIKDGFYKTSDGNTNINFNIPENYINIGNPITSYELPGMYGDSKFQYQKMDMNRFGNDIISKSDNIINFTNINIIVVILPLSVPNKYVSHGYQFFQPFQTQEKTIQGIYYMPPVTQINFSSWFGVEPFLHLHELMHPTNMLDDHYGDDFGRSGPDMGTGQWGIMSGMITDFLGWDKWISGMITDDQVLCINSTTDVWLKPSNMFGKHNKIAVLPVSNTKVIVLESMRAAGFNYKLPVGAQGLLVYAVDTSINQHGKGINVLWPNNRDNGSLSYNFFLSNATLKNNESIQVFNYTIKVKDAGAFGDIIEIVAK